MNQFNLQFSQISPPEPRAIAWLSRKDFARAQKALGFSLWDNRREFIEERCALALGYGAAGVTAHIQRVSLPAFERWVRLTGAPLSLDGLDAFAAHWRWRARNPDAPVCGRFGDPGDPDRYSVQVSGVQCLRIRRQVYVRWRDDFARPKLFDPPPLDVYAAEVVDCCLVSRFIESRPVVRSA